MGNIALSKAFAELKTENEYVQDFGTFFVCVNKLGGGTLGKSYDGGWWVVLMDSDALVRIEQFPVNTGMPHTHEWVAEWVAEDKDWS